jgi:hypothetical protein
VPGASCALDLAGDDVPVALLVLCLGLLPTGRRA